MATIKSTGKKGVEELGYIGIPPASIVAIVWAANTYLDAKINSEDVNTAIIVLLPIWAALRRMWRHFAKAYLFKADK